MAPGASSAAKALMARKAALTEKVVVVELLGAEEVPTAGWGQDKGAPRDDCDGNDGLKLKPDVVEPTRVDARQQILQEGRLKQRVARWLT